MNISVLGCGRWGTFIAHYLSDMHNVTLWGRAGGRSFTSLKETRKNDFLTLKDSVNLTDNLEDALKNDLIIISILTQELDEFLKQIKNYNVENKIFVFCMKGIDANTGLTLTQMAINNGFDKEKLGIWVGPGHVQNFLAGIPNCMVISAYNRELAEYLRETFSSSLIRFYLDLDIVGVEIGAAAKNVAGIMSGILDGLNLQSLKGALMARVTNEFSRLIVKLGGQANTIYGLSHLGDYEATLFSPFSHNRMFGEKLSLGEHYEKSAEGVGNTKGLYYLAQVNNVQMPLTSSLYRILYENANIEEEIKQLFLRPQIDEFC